MRNIPLLESVMQQIIDHPELHFQRTYFADTDCGTAGCFAGWACMLAGLKPAKDWFSVLVDGRPDSTFAVARALLGIPAPEAKILFDIGNTRRMLQLMVKDLINGDQLRDNDFYKQETYRDYVS